jgi:hypothetical protein
MEKQFTLLFSEELITVVCACVWGAGATGRQPWSITV